jgi:aminopeptidase N
MSKYRVKIEADKVKYPILLANGNLVEAGLSVNTNSRHWALWDDPFVKPCYLLAVVAGDYGLLKDSFTTRSGRTIQLEIYCQHGVENRCLFAMSALKKAMKWDEERYDREYDLDRYMILVVDDFNAGAMENKGLNIFNSRLVLADPQTATDQDYENIEAVIAHEYFHNWTGNRITLRDWFHLSLKEGLTVFRDQQFTEDQTSSAVKRIVDIQTLRDRQFTEDAGPNAHPVRPASCLSVDNFFTPTIYEKGAEIIRMIQMILGVSGFKKGMDYYFATYDGQAVTIENFIECFEITSKVDLKLFRNWYDFAGTPEVEVIETFDTKTASYSIQLTQTGQALFHIPLKMALFNEQGEIKGTEQVLQLKQKTETYHFLEHSKKPILSLLREFSAPVKLKFTRPLDELIYLSKQDTDGFNRWESLQSLLLIDFDRVYLDNSNRPENEQEISFSTELIQSFKSLVNEKPGALIEKGLDPALQSLLLSLPSAAYFQSRLSEINPQLISKIYSEFYLTINKALGQDIKSLYFKMIETPADDISFSAASRRSLALKLLDYLVPSQEGRGIAFDLYKKSRNLTEEFGALLALQFSSSPERDEASEYFFKKWHTDAVVFNKWLIAEGGFNEPWRSQTLQKIMDDTSFKITNPNNILSLLRSFAANCFLGFHSEDGSGYRFISEQIIRIDKLNPQTAARIAQSFNLWKKLKPSLRVLAEKEILKIIEVTELSSNTREIIKNLLEKST